MSESMVPWREYADMRDRVVRAEAALQTADGRIWQAEAALAEVQALRFDLQHKLDDARSALAERDRMLQLAYEMEELPAEWDPEGYAIWLADLKARAEEGSEK